MPTVLLVVTGDMERLALATSMGRLFPTADFEVQQLNGLTGNPLPSPPEGVTGTVPSAAMKLGRALVAAVTRGRAGTPADLAVGVDDLELANLAQPEAVVEWVRRAVRAALAEQYPSANHRERAAARVRECCSFHIFSPMTEAYFFADRESLPLAGVPPGAAVRVAGDDVESFGTDDEGYLAGRENRDWLAAHPKRYLEHLCAGGDGYYDEVVGGRRALESLRWPTVGSHPERTRFARSFLQDLADALGAPCPTIGATHSATYPSVTARRDEMVLRNA